MKTVTKTYNVYSFEELSKIAQDEVINNYINFYTEVIPYEDISDDMKKAVNKAESMQTPWFTGSYIYEYCLEEIMEGVKSYEYLENGDIFNE